MDATTQEKQDDPFAGLANFKNVDETGTLPSGDLPGAFRVHGFFPGKPGRPHNYVDDFYSFLGQGLAIHTKAVILWDVANGQVSFLSADLTKAHPATSETFTNAYAIDIGRTYPDAIFINLNAADPRIDKLSAFAAMTFEESLRSGNSDPTFDTLERLEQKCLEMGVEYRIQMPVIDADRHCMAIIALTHLAEESDENTFEKIFDKHGTEMRIRAWQNPISSTLTATLTIPSETDGYPAGYTCKIIMDHSGRLVKLQEAQLEDANDKDLIDKAPASPRAIADFVNGILDQLQ